jgi:hypothetical protein
VLRFFVRRFAGSSSTAINTRDLLPHSRTDSISSMDEWRTSAFDHVNDELGNVFFLEC